MPITDLTEAKDLNQAFDRLLDTAPPAEAEIIRIVYSDGLTTA